MAKCDFCKQEMRNHKTCTKNPVGSKPPIPYGEETHIPKDIMPKMPNNCHDCGVPKGGFHHPGCDLESCPVCNGQLLSCGHDKRKPSTGRRASRLEFKWGEPLKK